MNQDTREVHIKTDPHSANSDSDIMDEDDDSREAALAIEENIKEEITVDDNPINYSDATRERKLDSMMSDISLPHPSNKPPEKKKEIKTKKELEEEEREKMQSVSVINKGLFI